MPQFQNLNLSFKRQPALELFDERKYRTWIHIWSPLKTCEKETTEESWENLRGRLIVNKFWTEFQSFPLFFFQPTMIIILLKFNSQNTGNIKQTQACEEYNFYKFQHVSIKLHFHQENNFKISKILNIFLRSGCVT